MTEKIFGRLTSSKISVPEEMGHLGRGEFVLADGKQFVVAKGFELGLEDIDHRHRVTQGIEDLEVVTFFGAVTFVIFHRGRHVAAAQTDTRQINRQSNSVVERKFHDSLNMRSWLDR